MRRSKEQATTSRILGAIAEAGRPCTLSEIATRALPDLPRSDVRTALFGLVERGAIYPCPRKRYWDKDEAKVHFDHAMSLVAERPHTRAELVDALDALGTGASRSWRQGIVRRVATSIGIHRWPPFGAERSETLSTEPPDLEAYAAPLREPFEALAARLEQAGVPAGAFARAMLGDRLLESPVESPTEPDPLAAAPPQEADRRGGFTPADEAERDFHREIAQELVFAWEDTQDATARRALEQVMHNVGIRPLGTIGEEVPFDGTLHTSSEGLWPDDPARVEQSGWELQRGTRSRVLAKASVRGVGAPS